MGKYGKVSPAICLCGTTLVYVENADQLQGNELVENMIFTEFAVKPLPLGMGIYGTPCFP